MPPHGSGTAAAARGRIRQLVPTRDINGVRKIFKVLTESLRELDDPRAGPGRAGPGQERRELLAELLAREKGWWCDRAHCGRAPCVADAGPGAVGRVPGARGSSPHGRGDPGDARAGACGDRLGAGFGACFLALAWSDLRRRIIPNRIVYPALVLALAASGAWPDRGFAEALAGGLGTLAVAIAIRGLSGSGLGGGDVKMAALAGAVVGYPGVLSAGLWTATTGGMVAAVLLATRRADWRARVPYGPFLALGAIAALVG